MRPIMARRFESHLKRLAESSMNGTTRSFFRKGTLTAEVAEKPSLGGGNAENTADAVGDRLTICREHRDAPCMPREWKRRPHAEAAPLGEGFGQGDFGWSFLKRELRKAGSGERGARCARRHRRQKRERSAQPLFAEGVGEIIEEIAFGQHVNRAKGREQETCPLSLHRNLVRPARRRPSSEPGCTFVTVRIA